MKEIKTYNWLPPLPIKVPHAKNACIKIDKRNSEKSKYQSKLQKFVKVHT